MKVKDCCKYAPKTSIKAGDAIIDGKYMFFTSSADENKRFFDYIFDDEGIIMGTGGNATLHYYDGKFAVSTDCVVLFPDERVRCKYLYYFFKANMDILERGFKGAGLKHTNKQYISDIDLGDIPILEKQDEVIIMLDKVEHIIDAKKRQLKELEDLPKGRFVELFGDPQENPKGYDKRQLKESCKVITGNTPSRAVSEYYGEHIEWIKTDNIVNGFINPTPATESLSEKGMAVSRNVEKDSILMACIAGSVSSIGKVCITDRKVAFNQQINAIVPNDYNTRFLYVMLQISKEYLVKDINMALKGILSKSKLEEKEFIVPPMELQEEFATFVEQTNKSKVVIQKSLDEMQVLYDKLMQEYFG